MASIYLTDDEKKERLKRSQPLPVDQSAVDSYYRSRTGHDEAGATKFLKDNPGDVKRLYNDRPGDNPPGQTSNPTSGGPSGQSVADYLRSKGVSSHVIGDEAKHYGDPSQISAETLARYLARSTGGTGPGIPAGSAAQTLGSINDPRFLQQHDIFNDPLTKQYEALLQQQMAGQQSQQAMLRQFLDPLIQQQAQLVTQQQAQYAAQQKALEEAARAAEQRRSATGAATEQLTRFLNERVSKLQGPAYTGTEQEVLRTQQLDPLERDRAAAQKRALEQISSRGYELDSGVAQELLQQVNRAFDEQRTSVQGGIAQRQIEEQRSREQEAQQLLQYLAALPDAQARGDLEYVTFVQNLLNQPRQASLATGMAGGTGVAQLIDLPTQPGTQALSMADLLAELPTRRLNDSLAVLGMGPSPSGATSSVMQLLQQQQQQRYMQQQQAANYLGQIGQKL